MKFLVKRMMDNRLSAIYDSDLESIKKMKYAKIYEVEVKSPRNIMFHRKFFALIKMVFDNQDYFSDIDNLRSEIIIEAGFYTEYSELRTGEMKRSAKSMKFSKMDEMEFEDLYQKITEVIIRHFNFGKEEIINNVEQYF